MDIIYILLSLALGFALSGILFGITIVLSNTRAKVVSQFLMPIVSIIPVIILLIITRRNILNLYNLFDGISWIIIIVTSIIVIMLITLNSSNLILSRKTIFVNGLEGLMMEIPQRLLMQNFIFSIGIGYVFMRTELILLPMIAHFAERIISKSILNR